MTNGTGGGGGERRGGGKSPGSFEMLSTKLHGVTSQTTILFIVTAKRTTNLASPLCFHDKGEGGILFLISKKKK